MGNQDSNSQPRGKGNQRTRKQELDRVAQRASRQRAKNRLVFLEEKVAKLQASDSNEEVANLVDALQKSREENARLKAALRRIRAYTDVDATDDAQDDQCFQHSQPREDDRVTNGSLIHQDLEVREPDASLSFVPTTHVEPPKTSSEAGGDNFTSVMGGIYVESQTPTETSAQHNTTPDDFAQQQMEDGQQVADLIAELCSTQTIGTALSTTPDNPMAIHSSYFDVRDFDPKAMVWPQEQLRPPLMGLSDHVEAYFVNARTVDSQRRTIDERVAQYQAPFKSLFTGWDTVDAKSRTDPMWLSIRYIDERLYAGWTTAKKIATMFVSHKLIQYHSSPTEANLASVPEFLRPSIPQQHIQHPPVIDFLVWPKLRQRLVFTHQRYSQTGELGPALCTYSRFHWPFPDEKIVSYEQDHGWKISKLFQSYAFKIENWSMDKEFFERFPEMKNDIPYPPDTGFSFSSPLPGLHMEMPFCS